jgi:hypothetical protein
MLDSVDIDKIHIESLLFQTGYLTVVDVQDNNMEDITYLVDIPNNEVRKALNLHVLVALTENDDILADRTRTEIYDAFRDGDLQKALIILRSLFALIPHNLHVDLEAYYHSIFYAVISVLGFKIEAEVNVSRGCVDAILELSDKVYVMEFKYKKCPPEAGSDTKTKLFEKTLREALEQIDSRGYHTRYIDSGKTIYKTAFAFLGRDDIEMEFVVV